MNRSNYYITTLVVAITLLYLPNYSIAQNSESTIDTSRVYTLGEVIVSASRYEEDPQSVGRNVTVIGREQIEQSLHLNVAGILAEQQGIHMVGSGQSPGSLQQGFIRNANNHHSVVMIDGVRISDPSTVNNSVDLSEISLLGVERIEIVRGSHSTLYGSSAIGGVINIITRDRGPRGFSIEAGSRHGLFSGDSYATQNNLSANYSFENGVYLDAGIYQKWSRGMDATLDTATTRDAYNPQDRDGFQKLDLLGKVGYKTPEADMFVSYRDQRQTNELDQAAFSDDDNAVVDFGRGLFSYGLGYSISDSWQLNFEGAYSGLNRDFVNDSSLVDAQGTYDGTFVETNAEGTSWENSLTATFNGNAIRTMAGLETSIQTMNTRNYVYSRSSFGIYEETVDLDSLNLKEELKAAFVHSEINGSLISDKLDLFSLVIGGRLVDHNRFGKHVTYEFNPKVRISGSALIYAALTSGFHAPSLYQLNSPQQGFGAYTSRGNPGLLPEESISYEIGWRQEMGKLGNIELSLFRTEVKDVIEYVYLWNANTPVSNLTSSDYMGDTYLNISRQEINGLEIGLKLQPLSSLSLSGSLSITDSRLIFDPNDIKESYTGGNHVQIYESGVFVNEEQELSSFTRRPGLTAKVQAIWQPYSKLRLRLISRYVGNRDDIYYSDALGPFGAQGRRNIKGYNITDLQAAYRLTQALTISGKIGNLFDSGYSEIEGYRTRGRSFIFKARYELGNL